MLRRSLVTTTTAIAALALAAPVAGAASQAGTAEPRERYNRVVITDQVDDVWLWNPVSSEYDPVDSWPTADVKKGVGTHWSDSVEATMKFVDLKKAHHQEFAVKIKTPELTRVGWVVVKPGKWQGFHVMEKATGKAVSAKGMTHKVSYKRNTVQMVIPRSLLSNPKWVKVAMLNLMFTIPEDAEFVDNPQTTGPMGPAKWKKNPGLSARLYPAEASG